MGYEQLRGLAKAFKALSETHRIRIVEMLKIRPLCVCEITSILGLATSTVSRHLSVLREAGFITDEKDGKWVNYRLKTRSDVHGVMDLIAMLGDWLPDDDTIRSDAQQVMTVDRDEICGLE
jgi:ArsR family transcriptional regulator